MAEPPTDRLALLYRVSQTFNSSLDLDEVLNSVIDEVIAATRAERGFLMLRDGGGQLSFRAARGMDHRSIDEPEFQVSRSVVERVAQEGRPLLTSNAQSDSWLRARESVVVLGLRSILCVPLQIKGSMLGVIYVDNRLQAGIFKDSDLDLLTAIASSAASAIENARLYQVAVEKGRLERELQMARELQTSLLPRDTPELAGWEFAARWQPARQVAGDFYDFIQLNLAKASVPSQEWGIVVADVSDKGMPAALFMALSRSIVRASVTQAASPADGITQVNRLLWADSTNGMFVTLFYARISAMSGELTYVNAGHNPPIIYRSGPDELMTLTRTGMLLGVLGVAEFDQRSIQLDPGDFVVMYTDGVTEALNARGEEFGESRLRNVILAHRRAPAADVLNAIQTTVDQFVEEVAPFDDCTLVVLRRV